jgi:hypothetical protein
MPKLEAAHPAIQAVAAATLDTYEAAIRAISDLERIVARTTPFEPVSALAGSLADLTRDVAAVQLSALRWILDL